MQAIKSNVLAANLAVACLLIALTSLAGWVFGIPILKSFSPDGPRMFALTAVGFIAVSTSLLWQIRRSGADTTSLVLALTVLSLGLASGLFRLFGWAPEPLSLLARGPDATIWSIPSTGTSFLFVGIGTSLALMHARNLVGYSQAIAAATLLFALLIVAGFLAKGTFLYDLLPGSGTSLRTAAAVMLAAAALLTLRRNEALVGALTHPAEDSGALRQLFVPALVSPILLGMLASAVVQATDIRADLNVALWLFVWGMLIVLTVVIWRFAYHLNEKENARRQAVAALAQRSQELARSNAELEQMLYVASHDLQEPLRMVSAYMQLLEQKYENQLDADAHEFIGFAVDGAKRMHALIVDLLIYSRVRTRAKPLQATDCKSVMATALQSLRPAIEESGAQVECGPLPMVMCDADQLAQLFQNLIGNAIKFCGAEAPRIKVWAEPDDGFWRFAIQDNGIGIAPEYHQRIFVMFQRLHGRTEYPGTGIGLTICKMIVEQYGGRIWVEPAPQQGSVFKFTLPGISGATR